MGPAILQTQSGQRVRFLLLRMLWLEVGDVHMKSRSPYKGSKMKARIQSIEQLKEIATRELQTEIDQQISDALLDGAAQGMAYVMWGKEKTKAETL